MKNKNKPHDDELLNQDADLQEENADVDTEQENEELDLKIDDTNDNKDDEKSDNNEITEDDNDKENNSDEENDDKISKDTKKEKKKKRKRSDSRKLRYGGLAAALTVGAVVLVILINILGSALYNRFPLSLDLTKDKRYTMSEETETALSKLEKNVRIVIFSSEADFSGNTGMEELDIILTQFTEALEQYKAKSGGKIEYQYVDLNKQPMLKSEYPDNKSGDILFRSYLSKDDIGSTRDSVFTIDDLFDFDYNTNTITSSNVESQMTSALLNVSAENTPVIALLNGFEEDEGTVAGLNELFKGVNYELKEHNIASISAFPEDAKVAIIAAPAKDYDDAAIARLDEWLQNDKKYDRHLFVIASSYASCPNLNEYIKANYDIEITDNWIYEQDDNKVFGDSRHMAYGDITADEFTGNIQGKLAAMPYAIQLKTSRVKSEESAKTGFDMITFPETADVISFKTLQDINKELEKELANAQTKEEQAKILEKMDKKFTEAIKKADKYPVSVMAYANDYTYYDGTDRVDTHVVVCGSNYAFYPDYLRSTTSEFATMVLNTLNSMTDSEDQVQVQSYHFDSQNLEFSLAQQRIMFVVFVIVIPIAFVIIGISVFVRRRRL